jgi:acetyl esterase/lipase
MAWFLLFALAFVVVSVVVLRGDRLDYLDSNILPQPNRTPSDSHHEVVASMKAFAAESQGLKGKARLQTIRDYMDNMHADKVFASSFTPVSDGAIRGEWVVAPGVDTRRRVLYLHGGAFMMGSPRSHRSITNRLSEVANAAVFALDYRLLPENSRLEGIADCQNGYRWILQNGPDGPEPLDFLVVSGDSAGGNLTLMTIAWARDEGLRPADAAVALSPSTDTTVASDPMLGPALGKLTRFPAIIWWWATLFTSRMKPSDRRNSPLRGDLSGLPPVLVQASEAEMLLDDARRYVEKAQAAGTDARLQCWPHMVHVWQIFTPDLPEAEDAFERIGQFLEGIDATVEEELAA